MLLVLLSWIYIFLSASIWGAATHKIFKIQNSHPVISQLLGLFFICLFTSVFAFFKPINTSFHLVLLGLNILLGCWQKREIISSFQQFIELFQSLSKFLKTCFLGLSLLILAQAASAPFVIDNESYYLQTIKWLNEYGFVKGLANLHLFLAQNSGWHILQSAFNFSFLYENFNDLSAYLFCLVVLFAFEKLNLFFQQKTNHLADLFLAIIPLGSVLFFQFISAPSPDVPVFLISFLLFYFILKKWNNFLKEDFTIISLLSFFVLYLKVSSVFIAFIPLGILVFNFQKLKKGLLPIISVGLITLCVLLVKNQILTGYPLFPLQQLQLIETDYSLPKEYQEFFFTMNKAYAYHISYQEYTSLSVWERFKAWLFLPKLHGYFNQLIILLLVIFPFFILKSKQKKPLFFIYSLAILQLGILFFTSPQYRFFLVFILVLSGLLFFIYFQQKKILKILLIAGISFSCFPLFFSLQYNQFTNNQLIQQSSSFKLNNIIYPHKNSKYDYVYKAEQLENLNYQNPVNIDFLWITGDGKLPAIKKEQIEYFKKNFHIIPQLRTGKLEDGFYAKPIENFEDE
ncbi:MULTISPECIES: LIC_10190 family membrane protein [Mesonia]|uniref:Uncharacterized protein n=1 Tax=Mesonia oceanica TaxID=2687242 RepID=A0AC61YCW8_9FLAO|nr:MULTISPECIES: hypothetical protein [Mesonia]MAN27113.1 hypothetical protein [Mesonia sp.]MAQ42000.1 hypothetical protein [Mesonia sp.]MBJ97645.1 hypothetical protein [Flavobacteriaceae bacterium]VVV02100.1 hypothetical protein FVB9532_03396 [Mesonia oceanica]|tara:strand:- start:24787 stop:26499 length:1713 start_codon:yes stop_codon:yes gene_type:complete